MSFSIETPSKVTGRDLDTAAVLVSKGFGRVADEQNYADSEAHINSAESIQLLRNDHTGEFAGFAVYRSLLWR